MWSYVGRTCYMAIGNWRASWYRGSYVGNIDCCTVSPAQIDLLLIPRRWLDQCGERSFFISLYVCMFITQSDYLRQLARKKWCGEQDWERVYFLTLEIHDSHGILWKPEIFANSVECHRKPLYIWHKTILEINKNHHLYFHSFCDDNLNIWHGILLVSFCKISR